MRNVSARPPGSSAVSQFSKVQQPDLEVRRRRGGLHLGAYAATQPNGLKGSRNPPTERRFATVGGPGTQDAILPRNALRASFQQSAISGQLLAGLKGRRSPQGCPTMRCAQAFGGPDRPAQPEGLPHKSSQLATVFTCSNTKSSQLARFLTCSETHFFAGRRRNMRSLYITTLPGSCCCSAR